MSRRSTLKRCRDRKRRKHEQRKLALQLPPVRTISTARIFELLEMQTHILAKVIEESEQK